MFLNFGFNGILTNPDLSGTKIYNVFNTLASAKTTEVDKFCIVHFVVHRCEASANIDAFFKLTIATIKKMKIFFRARL